MFFSTTLDGHEKSSTTHVDHAIADSVTPVAIEAEIGGLSLPMNLRKKHLVASLHELTHETLLAMHVHYYREDERLLLPATTMRGVFDRWGSRQNVRIRWLAVDAEPMNIEHRPKTDFEHAAVKALKSGERYYEELASGQYSYAGPIQLTSECLKCHVPSRTSLRDRLAGIVIEMPVAIP